MKTVKIIEVKENDMNIILIYDGKSLVGINYNHEAGYYDIDYLKNDNKLFEMFMNSWSGSEKTIIEDALNTIYNKIAIDSSQEEMNCIIDDMFEMMINKQSRLLKQEDFWADAEKTKEIYELKERTKKAFKATWYNNDNK